VEKAWDSASGYVEDSKAFIFSLVNKENNPFKALCTNGAKAIYCDSSYGPTFGVGHDIYVGSGSNANQASYSSFGHTYYHASQSKLAGSFTFQTLEIEVFTKA